MERLKYLTDHPWAQPIAIALGASFTYLVFERASSSYRRWRALGPGGLPYNPLGWLISQYMSLVGKPLRTIAPYNQPDKYVQGWAKASNTEKSRALQSFLPGPLPKRNSRSKSIPFAAPQRERNANEPNDEKVEERYVAAINQFAERYKPQLIWGQSKLEKRGQALFLGDGINVPALTPQLAVNREVCHLHSSDLSAHVTLSLADAKEVVSKGWGERHSWSGTGLLPLTYTFLYVPRSLEEVDQFVQILDAGIQYMTEETA